MIIAINGKKGCGKDTWAEFFIGASKGYFSQEFTRLSFAQPIKDFVVNTLGCSYEEIEDRAFKESLLPVNFQNTETGMMTYRHLMQRFGSECVRDGLKDDFWIEVLKRKINIYGLVRGGYVINSTSNHIVTDMRFPNEFDAMEELGAYTVRIDRGIAGDSHASEQDLDRDFDLIIQNGGTLEDLRKTAIDLTEHLRLLAGPL